MGIWVSAAFAAFGCAQLAGLSDDYQLAPVGGAAGSSDAEAGSGASGGKGGSNAGKAGASNGKGGRASGGDTGASGGEAGVSAGEAGAGAGPSGGAPSGGAGPSGGAPSGGAGVAGSAAGGAAGAGGGPTRVGFSEFHDSGAGGDDASASLPDATFAKPPATAQGDFMLVFFGSDHSLGNLTVSSLSARGWTLYAQDHDYGSDGQATYLIYKFAGPNEPDPIVFKDINGPNGGNGVQGLLSVYRGVGSAAPVNAYQQILLQTGTDGTSHFTSSTPAITTSVAHCLLIAGLSPDTTVDAPAITAWPDGFAQNQVSVNNPAQPNPNGWANIYAAERPLSAAGTVPASAFQWDSTSGTQYYGSLAFVLALAP